jgi:hypothetical protein
LWAIFTGLAYLWVVDLGFRHRVTGNDRVLRATMTSRGLGDGSGLSECLPDDLVMLGDDGDDSYTGVERVAQNGA